MADYYYFVPSDACQKMKQDIARLKKLSEKVEFKIEGKRLQGVLRGGAPGDYRTL